MQRLSRHTSPDRPAPAGRSVPAPRGVTVDRRAPKVLLYSHDTFGLGNIRRTLVLAEALREEYPGAPILIVTGSPVIHAFRIPEGVDYIKLPCLDRVDADRYEPRYLAACSAEVGRTRRSILTNAVLGFEPDLVIVDKRPGGVGGELLDTIRRLRAARPSVKLVLGIRDILDEPRRTSRSLVRSGCFDTIERYYDEVWIYGMREIFDAVREYGFPPAVASKTRFCGYLKRQTVPSREAGCDPAARVLVTTGGSGDGDAVMETYLRGLVELPRRLRIRTTMIFGPHVDPRRRRELLQEFGYVGDVTFLDFEPDMTQHYAAADVVVSMAGYNAVCEILSFGKPAVLVPRSEPVREQLLRTRLFAARGYFEMIEPEHLTPPALLDKVLGLLHDDRTVERRTVDLDGLPRVRQRVRELLEARVA